MKSFFKYAFSLVAIVLVASFMLPADVIAMAPDSISSVLLDPFFRGGDGLMIAPVIPLANFDGTNYQTPNPGGIRALFLALKRDISGVWPNAASITAGEITVGPTMVLTKKFVEYQFSDSSCSLDDDDSGEPGFQSYKHTLGLMLAGFSKVHTAEMLKHLNAGCVAVVQFNDGTYAVGGTSDNALFLKKGFKSGSKGSDKRGFTLKGEQDGFMWGIMPLSTTVAAALPITAWV